MRNEKAKKNPPKVGGAFIWRVRLGSDIVENGQAVGADDGALCLPTIADADGIIEMVRWTLERADAIVGFAIIFLAIVGDVLVVFVRFFDAEVGEAGERATLIGEFCEFGGAIDSTFVDDAVAVIVDVVV